MPLILTRREGDGVMIGRHTSVRVHEVKGQQIKLSFDTPKGTPVVREELFLERLEKRKEAGKTLFPVFYRARNKQGDAIQGYALNLPDTPSVRYNFEPIEAPGDVIEDDHYIDLFTFPSEHEALVLRQGLRIGSDFSKTDYGFMTAAREGDWLVLVDHFSREPSVSRPKLLVYDYTLYRYEDVTNETAV